MAKGYFAPSVRKAFEILKLISSQKAGLGISEIARNLRMAKSTVHGMTSALEELGVVMREPETKTYTLGFTLFELGKVAYSRIDLKDIARPVMEQVMERTNASVFLGVVYGEHVTILDIVEPPTELKITSPVGTTIPLLAGAVGKVFLSLMEEDQASKLVQSRGISRYTPHSITDPDEYLMESKRARERGFATDDEEYILGVRAVAAPIQGRVHPMSAIWVVGFKASLDDDKMKAVIEYTMEAATAIREKIEMHSGPNHSRGGKPRRGKPAN
jgi:IclR family KDG regulon transcriptional repressor